MTLENYYQTYTKLNVQQILWSHKQNFGNDFICQWNNILQDWHVQIHEWADLNDTMTGCFTVLQGFANHDAEGIMKLYNVIYDNEQSHNITVRVTKELFESTFMRQWVLIMRSQLKMQSMSS